MSIPSLKRPRTNSQPPSPSTSSPKRAASEDNYPSSSDNGFAESGLLGTAMTSQTHGNSPLRLDSEADENTWVKQTEDVHLGSSEEKGTGDVDVVETAEHGLTQLQEHYSMLLATIPPPFKLWERYYIIPTSITNTLKLSFDSDHKESISAPRLDLSEIVQNPTGRSIRVIGTKVDASGKRTLSFDSEDEQLWSVKDGLEENVDFMFVSEEGWRKIVEWYGPYDGPSLSRFCVGNERIEMVPPVYTVYLVLRPTISPQAPVEPASALKPVQITCPSTTTMQTLLGFVQTVLADHITKSQDAIFRLWTLDVSTAGDNDTLPALSSLHLSAPLLPSLSGTLLSARADMDQVTCADAGLLNGDVIALEVGKKLVIGGEAWAVDVNAEGKAVEKIMTVPSAPPPLFSQPGFFGGSGDASSSVISTTTSSETGMQTRSQAQKQPKKGKGLVGLQNLGNTCFMNSAVQCLSNTPELNEYFLSGVYRSELNPDNPLGMNGEIARSFGLTIENLWGPGGTYASYSPRVLKQRTGHFAPQFAGYGQHDTQEFIAFLLDGLHEDLNRIQKKPYIEKPDWKPGGGDRELAELGKACWAGYKQRNDSVIVDLFQGQLKSTLVCPECHKESITLDPFMYLTVPLPIAQTRTYRCFFVPLDPDEPQVQLKVLIPMNASFSQVKEKIASVMQCKASNLIGFDLWNGGVYNWWKDSDHNGETKDSDVAVFHELAVPVTATRKAVGYPSALQSITVPVYTFKTMEPSKYRSTQQYPPNGTLEPFFITLSKHEATDPIAVRDAINKGYSRWVSSENKGRLWVPSGSRRAAVAQSVGEEDDEPVTEIHLEGDETRVAEVPSSSVDGSPEHEMSALSDSTLLNSPIAHRTASFASISDATSIKSSKSGRLVPRGDLFKVYVADASNSENESSGFGLGKKSDANTVPFWKGNPSKASEYWSRLENRKKAKKTGMLNHIASGFKSMVSSSYQSDDESTPPSTPAVAPLVVRPGEGIFCEWSPDDFAEFFPYADPTRGDFDVVTDPAIAKEIAKKKEGRNISLEDCLDEFSKEETLGQDDLWYCPQCKKHQAATKKLELYQVPDILVICIKRFGSSRRLSDKLDQMVSFPMEGLDLSDRIDERKIAKSLALNEEEAAEFGFQNGDEPVIYDLYAVDNHFGGLGGGHYTAFCRNKVDGQWYNYDDSRVSKADPASVQSRAAYLLFYRRRTTRPIGGLSRVKAEEASRAASPVPSSPEAGPSYPLSRRSSGSTSSTDPIPSAEDRPVPRWSPVARPETDDGLPPYTDDVTTPSTPEPGSPTMSNDSDESPTRTADFSGVASQIGFGNNVSWGSSSASTGVQHTFGRNTTTTAAVPAALPSPPDSEDGFEKIRKQTGASTAPPAGDNVGEDYEMVPNDSENRDTEMESPSRPSA